MGFFFWGSHRRPKETSRTPIRFCASAVVAAPRNSLFVLCTSIAPGAGNGTTDHLLEDRLPRPRKTGPLNRDPWERSPTIQRLSELSLSRLFLSPTAQRHYAKGDPEKCWGSADTRHGRGQGGKQPSSLGEQGRTTTGKQRGRGNESAARSRKKKKRTHVLARRKPQRCKVTLTFSSYLTGGGGGLGPEVFGRQGAWG